nr:gustatory receptor 29 [Pieris rapae]
MSLNMPQTIQLFFHGFYTVLVILLAAVLCKITEQFNSPTQTVSIIEVRPIQRHLTLVDMKSLYIEVYEIKLIIEQAFKAALIYSLLQSFHSLIAESYFIFYGILYSKNIPTYLIFNCAEWILCQVIKVYSISYSGNLLKNAVREHSRIHSH